jgi:hypothetical protein
MANLALRDLNQSRTSNFGPLTTTFTPPSSCSSLAVQINAKGLGRGEQQQQALREEGDFAGRHSQ